MTKQNYTDEMTAKAREMYAAFVEQYGENANDHLQEIADRMNEMAREAKLGGDPKTRASIRSKLVREQVYVASPKRKPAPKREGPDKKTLIAKLIEVTGRTDEKEPFKGIDGATKGAISEVIEVVEELKTVLQSD